MRFDDMRDVKIFEYLARKVETNRINLGNFLRYEVNLTQIFS